MARNVAWMKFLFLGTPGSIPLTESLADRFHLKYGVPQENFSTTDTMRQALELLEEKKPDIVVIFGSVESASWDELRITASLANDHMLGAAIARALHLRAKELSHEMKVCLAYHHEKGGIDDIAPESQSIPARGGLLLPWSLARADIKQFDKIITWAQAD